MFAASGRLLSAVWGHVVCWRLLPPSQCGSAICGRLQREQEEVINNLISRSDLDQKTVMKLLWQHYVGTGFNLFLKRNVFHIWYYVPSDMSGFCFQTFVAGSGQEFVPVGCRIVDDQSNRNNLWAEVFQDSWNKYSSLSKSSSSLISCVSNPYSVYN